MQHTILFLIFAVALCSNLCSDVSEFKYKFSSHTFVGHHAHNVTFYVYSNSSVTIGQARIYNRDVVTATFKANNLSGAGYEAILPKSYKFEFYGNIKNSTNALSEEVILEIICGNKTIPIPLKTSENKCDVDDKTDNMVMRVFVVLFSIVIAMFVCGAILVIISILTGGCILLINRNCYNTELTRNAYSSVNGEP